MQIKLGDTIRDDRGREGVITNIGIAVRKEDIAAEDDTSLNAKEYDTDLNYTGAVTFGDNWCYFMQIEDVIKKNRDNIITSDIGFEDTGISGSGSSYDSDTGGTFGSSVDDASTFSDYS